MKILIVDDEIALRNVVVEIMQSLYPDTSSIQVASNGEEAMRIYSEEDGFDIVISDLKMPGTIDGIDFLSACESAKKRILMSGTIDSVAIQRCEEAGITSLLYKPFTLEQITRVLEPSVI